MKRLLLASAALLSLATPLAIPVGPAQAEPSPGAALDTEPAAESQDSLSTQPPASTPGPAAAVPSSPAAVDKVPGTGTLGRWLGLPADSPWRLGGVWAGNGTTQLSGGAANSGGPGLAQQFLLDLQLDLNRSLGWRGAKVWVQGLQVNANPAAALASGSVQGSNSLVAPQPWDRTQLYSYAFSQFLFDDQVRLLVGKLVPSNDFANIVVPVAESIESNYWIPAVSSLTYTPLYAMPTLLGRLPGYPNSALGASLLIQPKALNRDTYLKLGLFDGRGGSGLSAPVQTGLVTPSLSGPLFAIGEIGGAWTIGGMQMPGAASFGLWHQGGPLGCEQPDGSCAESAATGGYLIAQQRILNFRYPSDNSGISTFLQAGWSPADSNLFTTSIAGGLTMFAPMRSRPNDSYGIGLSWARINERGPLAAFSNPSELMLQIYGQFHLISSIYLTPSFTVLPTVGLKDASRPSSSLLLQLVALF